MKTRVDNIIKDIFIVYKLNFTLEELLCKKSILLAYELSQVLNGIIKAGFLFCILNNKRLHIKSYYWCSVLGNRIDPIMKHYKYKISDLYLTDIYYPSIQEISEEVSYMYKDCFECFLNYK